MNKNKKWVIAIGVIMIVAGLLWPLPGEHLTTYSPHVDDWEYSVIREYVGGDAYNFIIGACLVGGRLAGMLAAKAIFIAVGLLLICLVLLHGESKAEVASAEASLPSAEVEIPAQEVVGETAEL